MIDRIDRQSSSFIHMMVLGRLDLLVAVFAVSCSYVGIPIIILTLLFYCGELVAWKYLVLVLTGLAITSLIKKLADRARPKRHANRLCNLRWMESNKSFPSGDSYQAACLATYLVMNELAASPAIILVVPMVMFARVYFGFHWIGDTIAGASLGIICTYYLISIV